MYTQIPSSVFVLDRTFHVETNNWASLSMKKSPLYKQIDNIDNVVTIQVIDYINQYNFSSMVRVSVFINHYYVRCL